MQQRGPSTGAFLKEHRRLIPRDAAALGPYLRPLFRLGRFVTQEEIAEAIGVSRVWYAMLESDAALRTSPRLLNRLATALALSDQDRDTLFKLALPELSPSNAVEALEDLYAIFGPLRTAAKRLWSATSESEVLAATAEATAQLFGEADFVGAFARLEPGQWSFPVMIPQTQLRTSLAEVHAELQDGFTAEQVDELMLHGVMTEPGQVGTRADLHRNLTTKTRYDRALEGAGFSRANFIDAHVQSRDGFAATIFALYMTHDKDFAEIDRSLFGVLANLASLALSGRTSSF